MSGRRVEHGACDRRRFPPIELRRIDLLSDLRRRLFERPLNQIICRQAYSDTLTGAQRRALDERLGGGDPIARVTTILRGVMMDLDGFKRQRYVRSLTGDVVLRMVFNQMARGVRNTDSWRATAATS